MESEAFHTVFLFYFLLMLRGGSVWCFLGSPDPRDLFFSGEKTFVKKLLLAPNFNLLKSGNPGIKLIFIIVLKYWFVFILLKYTFIASSPHSALPIPDVGDSQIFPTSGMGKMRIFDNHIII